MSFFLCTSVYVEHGCFWNGNLDIFVGHAIGLLLHIVDQLFIYCSKAGTSVYARASAKGKRIQVLFMHMLW